MALSDNESPVEYYDWRGHFTPGQLLRGAAQVPASQEELVGETEGI